uniref:Uncharacterized protein n=1 Tax=Panagrolaimus sp. PS1159 TaxID=55785 RepID=A0AC35GE07_9BILA
MSVLNRPIQGGIHSMQIPDMPKSSSSDYFQVVDYVDSDEQQHAGLFDNLKQNLNNFVNQFTGNVTYQKYPYSFENSFIRFQRNN